jgi:diguanylate cyclase (GGDEF)-like protein
MQLSDFGTEEQRVAALKELDILDTPPEERFDRLTRIATRIFNVPVAQITLLDGDRQWFKSIQGAELTEVPRAITFCTHTVETANGTMVVTDAEKDSRFDGNPMVHSEPNIRFYAGSSLSYSENVRLGTLCILDVKPRQMSENDIAILEDLAAVAQREIITMQLAMLDELTGLSNRRGFISRAESSLSLAKRENIKVSLAFIDLDKFKLINDNFGHKKGDEALVVFSRLVKSVCRSSDLIARIGGDEFVVLFMGSDKDSAEKKLKNLAEKIVEVNSNSPYEILFSHGVVECDLQKEISISALLDESDKLMYVDKNQKRKN